MNADGASPVEIKLPTDCGNAPRIGIVGDFAVNWAAGDTEAVTEWLSDSVTWTLVGDATHTGPESARAVAPPFSPRRVERSYCIARG